MSDLQIDRIVSEHKYPRQPSAFLVKWCGLEYSETTWEKEEEICRDGAGQVGTMPVCQTYSCRTQHWSQHFIQVHKWYTSTTAAPQLLDPVAVIAVSVHVHCVVAMLLSAHISDVPKLWLLIEVHNACECF